MFLTISGPSGVGKDTVVSFLFDIIADIDFLPSQTTRPRRTGDRGYVYVTDEEFEDMKKEGLLAWHTGPHGNQYGTLISDLENVGLNDDTIWVAVITPDRVKELRKWAEDLDLGPVISIYIYCGDTEELKKRLTERGDKDVEQRLEDCKSWDSEAKKYPFFVWVDNGGDINNARKAILNLLINSIKDKSKPQ